MLSKSNAFDVESRSCVLDNKDLPPEESWVTLPSLTSSKTLNIDVGVPPLVQEALKKAESKPGFSFDRERVASFEISGITQRLLSKQDIRRVLATEGCSSVVKSLEGSAILVRGVVSGIETLRKV